MALPPYFYIEKCPGCQQRIDWPFPRIPGSFAFPHRTKVHGARQTCRILITPDLTGHKHKVRLIPDGQRVETALAAA